MSGRIILKGTPASLGIASGKVRLIKNIKDEYKFQNGEILVAEITNPSMTVMMGKAVAIVTDIGGVTSHPAIVSRELGIPCVVATLKATKVLKDGMSVEVDGGKGLIYEK